MIEIKEYSINQNNDDTNILHLEPREGFLCGVACSNGAVCGLGCASGTGTWCGTWCD